MRKGMWVIVVIGFWVFLVNASGELFAAVPDIEQASQSSVIGKRVPQGIEKAMDDVQATFKSRMIKEALDAVESALQGASPKALPLVPDNNGVSFFVRKVQVKDSQLLTETSLAPLLEPFEGHQQTIRAMQGLADMITAEYRKRGYLSSQAYIAPQEIADGVFTVSVLEGRIGRVIFEGNKHYSTEVLSRYCVIHEGDFFRYQKLQESVFKLNAHPDRVVRAIIRRGSALGQTDIIFKVDENKLLASNLLMDNRGSKPVGQHRGGLGLRRDNLFGQDDTLRMGTMIGKAFSSGFVEHALPIQALGSVWKTGVSMAKSAPRKQYKPYRVSSTSMDYWGRLETRFITTESLALDWRTGMDIKESRTMVLSGTDSRERLRVIRFGPTLTLRDDGGMTVIDDQFSLGLNAMGAVLSSGSSQRAGVTPAFFASDFSLERLQRMPLKTRLSLKGRSHLSGDKQPASEQMLLGGADTVRGYPEGDYFADQGVLMNAEYLVPFFFIPDAWKMPGTKNRMRDALDFAFFYDHGLGWVKSPVNGQKASTSLRGTGVGVRVRMAADVYFTMDLAYAIGAKPDLSDNHFRIHSAIQANF